MDKNGFSENHSAQIIPVNFSSSSEELVMPSADIDAIDFLAQFGPIDETTRKIFAWKYGLDETTGQRGGEVLGREQIAKRLGIPEDQVIQIHDWHLLRIRRGRGEQINT